MERRLVVNKTTLTNSMHHPGNLWKSPRGTMLRIEALAVAAIIITFFLIAFGSCRRWSNRWIVQKGFFAAQVLSLSLGTYSIGLMQSSSVKSDMYPIWTVSLFTLFGCIDPVTSYNGLDYKGQLSKVIYGICLHCGYVVLMSISAISSVVGNTAIGVLSAITFMKGFHRSLALVQQRRMRNMVEEIGFDNYCGQAYVLTYDFSTAQASIEDERRHRGLVVDFPTGTGDTDSDYVCLYQVDNLFREKKDELPSCYDACAAHCLSHYLQRHFLGLRKNDEGYGETFLKVEGVEGYKRAFKVIEIELAFLYDIFFTGNAFLHFYQAKTASLWALASLSGICFVGVAAAIPGTIASSSTSSGSVDTTTADLVITFAILVSVALLQLLQLIRCWTSNWARVAVVCAYIRRSNDKDSRWRAWWIRLKASVATSSNLFDKFLWQEKMAQLSMLSASTRPENKVERGASGQEGHPPPMASRLYRGCVRLVKVLGLDYIWEVLWDLLGRDTNKGDPVRLDKEVKAYIIDFLAKLKSNRLDRDWISFPHSSGTEIYYLPHSYRHQSELERKALGHGYTINLILWCIVTGHCEAAEQELDKKKDEECRGGSGRAGAEEEEREEEHRRSRRVANALCNYCAYLVASAPELLPGPVKEIREAYDRFMTEPLSWSERRWPFTEELLARPERWEIMVAVWVRMLVYAAPYGSPEAHMRHLSQGGEFITHLWALLFHLDIREWRLPSNLHEIETIDQAKTILTEFSQGNKSTAKSFLDDGIAVVAFLFVRTLFFLLQEYLVCIIIIISFFW
ncbi:hypothetical protein HU200_012913 [Digitaria exilis]|uniref:DUF4220 domain-containing protein n=1 Tax=Digitaria exilis TaxID=1010633 RepID=A0A835KK34_9POAL|nr:hypothetical protein HU200_012913 [Digitaria exilis]